MSIQQLAARYTFAFDSLDAETYADCFAPDGRFHYGSNQVIEGRDALRAFPQIVSGLGQLRHMVTGLLVDGDGERATCRSYCQVFAIDDADRSYVFSQGVYEDALIKVGGEWRYAERRYLTDPVRPPRPDSYREVSPGQS